MTVADLVRRLDAKKSGNGWMAKCPAHKDRKASLSISEGKNGCILLNCFAGCPLDEILAALDLAKRDLFPDSMRLSAASTSTKPAPAKKIAPAKFDWQQCVAAMTDKHITHIAEWRGFDPLFVRELRDKGSIGIYDGLVAFPVENDGKIVAAHVRKKDGNWFFNPSGIHRAPLVFGEVSDHADIFESTWDGLDYMDKSGERDCVIITRGASNGELVAGLIPEGAVAYLWPQNDEVDLKTGKRPGEEWKKTVCEHVPKSCAVKLVKIPAHDLNDWTRNGATAENLLAAKANAGTLREANHDEATIARLAALPPIEYDRIRLKEADKLGVRVATLDADVERKRAKLSEGETLQGNAVDFPFVDPYETSVNGAQVLDEVAATFRRYIVLPAGAADALALWVTMTHCFEAFEHVPRLNCCSPDKSCGKTTLLDVTACFVARPLRAENITTAVLFRLVEQYKPTLLLDEVDTYLKENEELRGCLNAGHKRGGKAYRCEGQDNTVRSFAVFAPAALAGIGALPGTLHDRSIVIKLVRAKAGEIAARFDSRRVHYEIELCRKLARWTDDNFEELKNCDPQLPETAFNRLADNWRPLFAIAQVAGNDWPQRAHAAFVTLTSSADFDAQGVGTLLLSDIAVIFAAKERDKLPSLEESFATIEAGEAADKLPSAVLAASLAEIEGRPWAEWGKQRKPISRNQLANQLRRFGISPRGIRVGEETPRGYMLDDFREAFSRFVPGYPLSDCNTATMLGKTPISEVQQAFSVLHPEKTDSQSECCSVAVQKGVLGEDREVSDESDTIPAGTYEL